MKLGTAVLELQAKCDSLDDVPKLGQHVLRQQWAILIQGIDVARNICADANDLSINRCHLPCLPIRIIGWTRPESRKIIAPDIDLTTCMFALLL